MQIMNKKKLETWNKSGCTEKICHQSGKRYKSTSLWTNACGDVRVAAAVRKLTTDRSHTLVKWKFSQCKCLCDKWLFNNNNNNNNTPDHIVIRLQSLDYKPENASNFLCQLLYISLPPKLTSPSASPHYNLLLSATGMSCKAILKWTFLCQQLHAFADILSHNCFCFRSHDNLAISKTRCSSVLSSLFCDSV